jgi:hypothetical protein
VSMAVVMSEMPDLWRKVLAEHVPDAQGNCHECFHAGGRASWPCQTYRIAEEAKWVAEGGLPGTGPHGPGPSRTRLSPPEPQTARRDDPLEDPLGSTDAPSSTPSSTPFPATGGWRSPSTGSSPLPWLTGESTPEDHRPFAGDPLASGPVPADRDDATGERPYGSTFDAPYGASFGIDDRPRAAH